MIEIRTEVELLSIEHEAESNSFIALRDMQDCQGCVKIFNDSSSFDPLLEHQQHLSLLFCY